MRQGRHLSGRSPRAQPLRPSFAQRLVLLRLLLRALVPAVLRDWLRVFSRLLIACIRLRICCLSLLLLLRVSLGAVCACSGYSLVTSDKQRNISFPDFLEA